MNLVVLALLKQREISSCMLHLNFTTNIWEDGVAAISFISIDVIRSFSPQIIHSTINIFVSILLLSTYAVAYFMYSNAYVVPAEMIDTNNIK